MLATVANNKTQLRLLSRSPPPGAYSVIHCASHVFTVKWRKLANDKLTLQVFSQSATEGEDYILYNCAYRNVQKVFHEIWSRTTHRALYSNYVMAMLFWGLAEWQKLKIMIDIIAECHFNDWMLDNRIYIILSIDHYTLVYNEAGQRWSRTTIKKRATKRSW